MMHGYALLALIAALGMRHGLDPDHLSAIDGLARIHPSRWNGAAFALGHGLIVTLLAVGFGTLLAKELAPYSAWILLALGILNLWRIWRPSRKRHHSHVFPRVANASPLMLGLIFGMGFETASQLSALMLADRLSPWLLGLVFSSGMVVVDGADGFMAARTQRQAQNGHPRAMQANRALGFVVGTVSIVLGIAEMAGNAFDRVALPLGTSLFALLVGLRLWSYSAAPGRHTHTQAPSGS